MFYIASEHLIQLTIFVIGYLSSTNPYFGATIGRVCNRIGKATFSLNGTEYQLAKNNGDASLHGGFIGFDKFNWSAFINGDKVCCIDFFRWSLMFLFDVQ